MRRNQGFAKIDKKDYPRYKAMRKKIPIAPGDIFIFYERMVHEVLPSAKKKDHAVEKKEEKPVLEEPTSPKRRLGDRGRDKKVRKKRYPNGMPEERKQQLARAREKALKVRKERALQRKTEKKREMNARYNHPAPEPERKPTQPVNIHHQESV